MIINNKRKLFKFDSTCIKFAHFHSVLIRSLHHFLHVLTFVNNLGY